MCSLMLVAAANGSGCSSQAVQRMFTTIGAEAALFVGAGPYDRQAHLGPIALGISHA